MKKNIYNKMILVIVILLAVLATCFYANPTDVATDSGFDTSYGSSGGSYSGGSSRHNSHSSGNRNGVSDMTTLETCIVFSVLVVLAILTISMAKNSSVTGEGEYDAYTLNKKKAITDDKFKGYIKDESMEDFLLNRYQDYLAIQYAWMEFKYNILSEKTTNELYNQYVMQLETLKTKNQKNVMKEFIYIDSMITEITNHDNETAVTLELITTFYDYIEDSAGIVRRGSDSTKVCMYYKMVFVKNNNISDNVCPNCGAKLENNSTITCNFCHSKITRKANAWLLAKKECLKQK